MDHEEIRLKLAAYLDNAVSDQDKVEIKRHLGMCGVCRGEIADLELTLRYLKSLPEIDPPSWLPQKVMAMVMEEHFHGKSLWRKLFYPLHVKLPIGALVVGVICVAAYNMTALKVERHPQPDQRTALRPKKTGPSETNGADTAENPPAAFSRGPGAIGGPPSVVEPQKPETALPVAPQKQEEAAPPARSPVRRTVEPELQPVDSGFMADGETTRSVRDVKAQAANRAGKRRGTVSGEKEPGTAGPLPIGNLEISLEVDDPANASKEIEGAVTRLSGRVNGHSYSDSSHLLSVRIGTDKIRNLVERLGQIGTIKEMPQTTPDAGGFTDVVIKW